MGSNGYTEGELEDEAVAKPKEPHLEFKDDSVPPQILNSLNMMRKNRTFCDVVLHVENADIPAHRAVLASVSPHFLHLFTVDNEFSSRSQNPVVSSYRLDPDLFEKSAVENLVNFAYTACLHLNPSQIRSTYVAAVHLNMEPVAKECAKYLIMHLTPESCIGARSLPGVTKIREFVSQLDGYICKNFPEVSQTQAFLTLPCVCIEVLTRTKSEMSLIDHQSMCRLAFDWLRQFDSPTVEEFTGKTHMLYLALDNSLQDCSELPNGDSAGDTELVQDYKKLTKLNNASNKKKKAKGAAKPRIIVYGKMNDGDSIEDDLNFDDRVIASTKVSDTIFVALVTIGARVASMSVVLRLNPPIPTPNNSSSIASDLSSCGDHLHYSSASSVASSGGRDEDELGDELDTPTYCDVTHMSSVKCSAGVGAIGGKLLVCGGYDRGECLKLVELYDPSTNKWTKLAPMAEARGRFNIAVVNDRAYAVGGCNGTTELTTVESLPVSQFGENVKWEQETPLPHPRSHPGVTAYDGKIYCLGGYDGQTGIKQADVYDPVTKTWRSLPPLNTGRYQAAAVGFNGQIWVVGGCDGWNCINTVEIYDLATDSWTYGPPLSTQRRGAGLTVAWGRLYCAGGWDGARSLASTEIYDSEEKMWIQGPQMTIPRSNLGLAAVGDALYAVGGFSNKTFLSSVEVLYEGQEWTTFCLKKER